MYYHVPVPQPTPCPSCGRCPRCGSPGYWAAPVWPIVTPFWYSNPNGTSLTTPNWTVSNITAQEPS